ncbi:MAG: sigma-70 family RNA polymerase sigma factor [Candidatus Dormiibacterota bacterium]
MSTGRHDALEHVYREEAGRLVAALVRLLGDFDLAEDMVAEALLEALDHWPRDGVPDRPGAWLLQTARRKALDRLRREQRGREKLALVASLGPAPRRDTDDRLRLLFTCCHPALPEEGRIALTLRAVAGLTTREIARAFVVPEATIAQRIVRAKRKIAGARIAYRLPEGEDLHERLRAVLTVLYLVFNEGYLATAGEATRAELAQDAEWLVGLVAGLLPDEPEPLGLLALFRLHRARWAARFDGDGRLLLLQEQDRRRWDRAAIADAGRVIRRAAALGRTGPYQVQAAIAAVHAEASSWEQTDWPQIVALYSLLASLDRSAVVRLNRAIARSHVVGPAAALADVETLAAELDRYYLFYATRAALLRELGRGREALLADERALALTANPAERRLLRERRRTGSGP